LGCATDAASSLASNQAANAWLDAASGRGIPAGGMDPVRSFQTTFSHNSACSPTLLKSACSSTTSAVLTCALWQPAQYFVSSARFWEMAASEAPAGAWCVSAAFNIAPALQAIARQRLANIARFRLATLA
jgi:hypothetical protein